MFRPLRMLLQPMLVALLVSATSSSVSAETTPTCKRLTDSDSPFLSALSVLMGPHSFLSGTISGGANALPALDPRVFEAIDKSLPTLSQCVAETSPLDLLASLMASPDAQKCWRDISQMNSASRERTATSSSNDGSNGDDNGDSTTFRDEVCPAAKVLAPCLTDVLMPALERAMANAHGCCDPLNAQITAAFGSDSLQTTVSSMVGVLGNALCTTREHSSSSTVETCGDSLVNNWIPHGQSDDEQKATWAVLNSFQIPNSQVCKAAGSEPFQTTLGKTEQYGADDITPYGACYAPMDELLQYVRGLPLWKLAGAETAVAMDLVFGEDDRCLPGDSFIAWASDENGPVLKSAHVIDEVADMFTSLLGNENHSTPPADASNSGDCDDSSSSSSSSTTTSGSGNDEDEQGPGVFDDSAPGVGLEQSGNFATTVRSFLTQVNYFARDVCVHLPNGVTCDFPDDEIEQPFVLAKASSSSSD